MAQSETGTVVAGEALIDLIPVAEHVDPQAGGAATNVARGLARLGTPCWLLAGLSTDAYGASIREQLTADGVDLSLAPGIDLPTTLALLHDYRNGEARYRFYLEGTAAASVDLAVTDLPAGVPLHVSMGAVGLAWSPTGRSLVDLLRREHGWRLTSLDPNVRDRAVADAGGPSAYRELLIQLLPSVDLLKLSAEDLEALSGDEDPEVVLDQLRQAGPVVVLITRDADGAEAVTADGRRITAPAPPVEVVDSVSAGDAFTARILDWLSDSQVTDRPGLAALRDDELQAAMTAACEVATETCRYRGAIPAARPPKA